MTHSTGSVLVLERHTVHVSDDSGRIAMLEKRTIGTDDSPPTLTRYVYSNHLQSASLELDGIGDIISYEEYHPYGTTTFQAKNALINAVAKRYRYTGKERDEESGLYYHGARYYIPWLCRWTAIDPMESKYAGMNPYNYSFNNPVMFNDPSGMEGEATGGWYVQDRVPYYDKNLHKESDMKTLGLEGSYIGPTFFRDTDDGGYVYGSESGDLVYYEPTLEGVTVTGVHPRRGLLGDRGYNVRQASLMGLNYNEDLHKRLNAIDNSFKGIFAIGASPFLLIAGAEAGVFTTIGTGVNYAGTLFNTAGRASFEGVKWVAKNQFARDFSLKWTSKLIENHGDPSKIDYFDVTLSTINPLKKYGFIGRAATEGINAFVDVKPTGISIVGMSENNQYIGQKKTKDAVIDFMFGYTKSGIKETMKQVGTNSKMGDFTIDVISGLIKKETKKSLDKK